MTVVGFTGAQGGMTPVQGFVFRSILPRVPDLTEFRHGDDAGADAQAHDFAVRLVGEDRIVVHPPDNPRRRAFRRAGTVLEPAPYLARDRDLVNALAATDGFLIAAPGQDHEVTRSGTWATVRWARRRGVPRVIVWPDGRVTGDVAGRSDAASDALAARLG